MDRNQHLPLVSFCTQTYNSARWIEGLLNCAKNQTYPNLELIISDDCSTDNTVQLVRDWIALNGERFSRCVLVSTTHNLGYAGNKANAEKQCQGDYIKSIDSDDLIDNTFIEKAVYILEQKKEYSFLFTNSITITQDGYEQEPPYYVGKDAFHALFMLDLWINTNTWFYRREVMESTSYRPEMFLSEDYLRLLEIASKYRLYHLDEYLSYCRRDYDKAPTNMFHWYVSQLMAINHFKDYSEYPNRSKLIKQGISYYVYEDNRPLSFISLAFQFHDPFFIKEYFIYYKRKIKLCIKSLFNSKQPQ